MTRNRILIAAIAIVLVIITLILFIPSEYTKELKDIELSNKNFVANKTGYESYSLIVDKGLELAGLENKVVLVRLMPHIIMVGDGNSSTLGTVTEQRGQYIMSLVRQPRFKQIEVIAHEIIHIVQFEEGRLQKGPFGVFWDGVYYPLPYELDYLDRPWEFDASIRGIELANQMKEALLVKKIKKDLN